MNGVASATALAYWLNPATILTGSVLGYVEPLLALPATAAIIAASSGRPALAGILAAAAMLTKQNAILALPATLLALIADDRSSIPLLVRVARFTVGALAAVSVAIAPVVWSGGALNMLWSLASPLRDPFLSGNAANVWWLIGNAAPHAPVDLCRIAGAAAVIAVIAWTIVRARLPADVWLCAAAAALSFHAYHVLAVSAHEPHLFPAVPLLALAAAGRPRFWLATGRRQRHRGAQRRAASSGLGIDTGGFHAALGSPASRRRPAGRRQLRRAGVARARVRARSARCECAEAARP